MNVGKAWHYLLVHPSKGYYTGYKGPEAFGTLEDAKVYRTEQEAYMARLIAGVGVYVESCLLWHNRTASTLNESSESNSGQSDQTLNPTNSHVNYDSRETRLKNSNYVKHTKRAAIRNKLKLITNTRYFNQAKSSGACIQRNDATRTNLRLVT